MSGPRRENLQGSRFGRLIVNSFHHVDKSGHTYWLCICSCGKQKIVRGSHLKTETIKSCGCLAQELRCTVGRRQSGQKYRVKTHGQTNTRLYGIWRSMRYRCRNKNARNYSSYGGRGIKVCREWDSSFTAFYEWSIANGYEDQMSIDRIDNDKGYRPDNCRWTTRKVQQNNRSVNHNIEFQGTTRTIREWEDILGFPKNLLSKRIIRNWDVSRALTTPVTIKEKTKCHKM